MKRMLILTAVAWLAIAEMLPCAGAPGPVRFSTDQTLRACKVTAFTGFYADWAIFDYGQWSWEAYEYTNFRFYGFMDYHLDSGAWHMSMIAKDGAILDLFYWIKASP